MVQFSANLGFLWTELLLPDAIRAAGAAGFDAVECHGPYNIDPDDVNIALRDTGLSMRSLNTWYGKDGVDNFGGAAVPGRESEAKGLIDQAIAYANQINCPMVHVLAGKTDQDERAELVYRANLSYAADEAAKLGKVILIEPLNVRNAPGYHLSNIEQAVETIEALGRDNVKVMFDCYHVQIMQGDLIKRIEKFLPQIGHIQIAGVPDRGEPDAGEVNFPNLLSAVYEMGYTGFIGAEYTPRFTTEAGLGWLKAYW